MNKLDKLDPDDVRVIELFKAHCEQGWSVNLFSTKLQGGVLAYRYLKDNNPEFRELHLKYKKRQAKWHKK